MLNFVIWSPEHTDKIGGIMVLHLLAKKLADKGQNVLITAKRTIKDSLANTLDNNKQIMLNSDTTMAIYPEIVIGNPFNSKYVTRWLLNTPGVLAGDGVYGDNDLIYKFCDFFNAPDESKVRGHLRTLNGKLDFFVNKNLERNGECHLVKKGKHKILNKHSPESLNIDNWPNEEFLLDIFNTKEKFISYDAITYHSVQAALCGCLSIVIPEEGISRDEFFQKSPTCKYGVAYGMDDIEHAINTRHLVRDHIEFLEKECDVLVENFINDCYSHMNIQRIN